MEKDDALFVVGSAMTCAAISAVARLVEDGKITVDQAEAAIESRLTALKDVRTAPSKTEDKPAPKKRGRPKKEETAEVDKEPQITLDEIRDNYLNKAKDMGIDRDAILDVMEKVAGTRKLPAVDVKHYPELLGKLDALMREHKAVADANEEAEVKEDW